MPSTHTSLHVHVVFSTKERFPFIDASWRERLHEYIGGSLRGLSAVPVKVGGVQDHIHFLAGLHPTVALSDLVREVKKASTKWVKEAIGISKFGWQDGYGGFTVCRDHVPAVAEYIANQEEHHRRKTFQEEYREFLEEWDIPFDPRYLW